MSNKLNYDQHTFHSPRFQDIVDQAIQFFNITPTHSLSSLEQFIGAGVYAPYYTGQYGLYLKIANSNHPIYVGKAVPPGWRTARTSHTKTPDLYRRLSEHIRSIEKSAIFKRMTLLADL